MPTASENPRCSVLGPVLSIMYITPLSTFCFMSLIEPSALSVYFRLKYLSPSAGRCSTDLFLDDGLSLNSYET